MADLRTRPPQPAADPRPAGTGVARWLGRLVLGAVLIGALVAGGTLVRVWQVARADDRAPADMIVVLGAAQYDGRPSEVLEARLDQALELYQEGVAPVVVTVGGRLPGDNFTEAEAGAQYLSANGVPADAVLPVGEGDDTLGSIQAVAAVAAERGWDTAVIVSDPWHSQRARVMARDSGLDAWTSPTRSGPMVWTRETQARSIFRESAALLYYQLTHASAETTRTGLS